MIVVSWKIPTDFTGEKSYYDPSWLIAENLDQNSLAEAFKKFPMDADPKREDDAKLKSEEKEKDEVDHFELDDDELDFSDDEEEEEQESDEEEEELEKSSSDEMQEYEEKEDVVKDPDVSHLEDSGKFHRTIYTHLLCHCFKRCQPSDIVFDHHHIILCARRL